MASNIGELQDIPSAQVHRSPGELNSAAPLHEFIQSWVDEATMLIE